MVGTNHKPGCYEKVRQGLRLRNYSHKTIKSYLSCLRSFVKYSSPRHPRDISNDEIRSYLLYLIDDKKLAPATVNQIFNALRFLYVEIYIKPFVIGTLPGPQKGRKLPSVLSQEDVLKIFSHIDNLKHKTLFMLIYSAGLRVGESVNLKLKDIDSEPKLIHIHAGKGKKDRYTLLSDAA